VIPISYNVRSLLVRRANTLASVLGIALVVFVLASSLMLSEGIHRTMGKSGRDDNAIVIRKGSDNELSSSMTAETAGLILATAGVQRRDSNPVGVKEVVVVTTMDKLGTTGVSNVLLRGVQLDELTRFRPNVRVTQGRMASAGTDEVVVGKAIAGRFRGLGVGESFEVRRNRPFRVVGVFEDEGSSYESEVFGDVSAVQSAFGRNGGLSSVRVRLESAAAFEGFEAGVERDKRLGLEAMRESDFNEKQSEMTGVVITAIGVLISLFFGFGAAIGSTITMYTSISSRQREVGTLRALGFRRGSILGSFLLEALFIALIGGAVGLGGALLMGFVKISLMNFQTFSEMVFTFTPTPKILLGSLAVAAITGVLGGLYPAWKASRLSPVAAMKR
jgi:putative ABC transport system permease protein